MRWSLLIAVCGLSITDVASFAQRPPADQRLDITRSANVGAGFFNATGVVRFQLIQGRLCLDPPRHRKGSQQRDEGDVYESITVTAQRGIPSLHYVCQHPDHHVTLSVQQADAVRIESWFPGTGERSVLNQPHQGMIRWMHQTGKTEQQREGATLLHLRAQDPHAFDAHFGWLIERVLQGNSLRALSESTHDRMIQRITETDQFSTSAESSNRPNRDAILRCVDQLGAKRRSVRTAAARQLLSWGSPILPVLQQIHREQLDIEQHQRLQTIMRRLRPCVNDTPASLAGLLAHDRTYWELISSRLASDQMRLANAHLQSFGDRPIPVAGQPVMRVAERPE